jgi:hypothetical protein
MLNLDDFWRSEYDNNSYMSHLTTEQLSVRAKYLIENLTTLEKTGKIGLRNIQVDPGRMLMQLFTHVLQELDNRTESFVNNFMFDAAVPKPQIKHSARLIEIGTQYKKQKPHLIKFGKKKWINSLKISLAKSFDDSSLNFAQMDDEMKAIFQPHPSEIKITDMSGKDIPGVKSVELSFEIDRDYYVYCSSHSFDYRLFGDFDADCCLFIFDSHRFSNDIMHELVKQVDLEDHGFKPVKYLDPIKPETNGRPEIEFHKHLKYSYQNEFRHVFIPNDNQQLDKDIFVTIPRLYEYSELVNL